MSTPALTGRRRMPGLPTPMFMFLFRGRYRQMATDELLTLIGDTFNQMALEFNKRVERRPLKVDVKQIDMNSSFDLTVPKRPQDAGVQYTRVIVSNAFWAISVRGRDGVVEVFNLPALDLRNLLESESATRLKLRLELVPKQVDAWMMDGLPVGPSELSTLLGSLFKDMVVRSKGDSDMAPEALRVQTPGGASLTGSVRTLFAEKHSLMQKIVDQQERIQNQIARDIHDAVIGNIMSLKRSLSENRSMSDAEMIEILNSVIERLREICQDLAPRDLKDWGLPAMLEEMCHGLAKRTGCYCAFNCRDEMPEFPHEVNLHIYRIVQECFNNIEKYADATKVDLNMIVEGGILCLTITDDGKGFFIDQASSGKMRLPQGPERAQSTFGKLRTLSATGDLPKPDRVKEGGSGASIIKERVELISCFFPSQIQIESEPGKGTKTTLEIQVLRTDL